MTEKNTNDASSFSFNDVFKNANIAADVVRVTPDLPGEGKQVDPTRQQTPHPAEANQQPFQECRRENARVGSEGRGAVQSAERGERTPAAQKERRKRASVGQGNPRTPAERASAERASAERGERMPAERAQARRREDVPVAARTGTPRGQRASEMSGPDRNYQRRSRGVSAGGGQPLIPSIGESDAFFEGNNTARFTIEKGKKKHTGLKVFLGLLLVALLAWGGTLGYSAFKAKDAANVVLSNVKTAQKAVKDNNFTAALGVVDSLSAHAAILNKELSGPQWALATVIPVIGDDVKAVRTLADVLDNLSSQALKPMADIVAQYPIDSILSSDGVNGAAVAELSQVVSETAPLMQDAADKMQNLPPLHIEKLSSKITPLVSLFGEINGIYQTVGDYAPVINGLLGVEGSRTYLIAAQNTAEIRAGGGFPGAMGLLMVDNGVVEMGDFGSPWDLLTDTYPEGVSTPEESGELFFADAYLYPRDVEYNPDFKQCAQVWAASYEAQNGVKIDGVISVTPAVVQRVLALTGDITLSDGTEMTGENATKVLQSDLYWRYSSESTRSRENNAYTDALFGEAAQKSFKKLMSDLNLKKAKSLLELVEESADKREIMVYFANDKEQALIDDMGYSGSMNDDPLKPQLGVFFSITTASKLGWYVDIDSELSEGVVNDDGTTSYQVSIDFSNTLSSSEVESAGLLIAGLYDGDMGSCIHLIAPAGGSISDFSVDMPETRGRRSDLIPETEEWVEGTFQGLQTMYVNGVSMMPGDTVSCSFTVTTAKGAEPLTLATTPTLTEYR